MIQEYREYLLTLKGYSKNTANAYTRDLGEFVNWAKKSLDNARWSAISRADIDQYIKDMVAAGLKPATTNRRLAAISGLYRYMIREGLTNENPCQYESRRKIGENVPNTIPTEDLQKAYNNAAGVTREMLGLLITTGIRIQELLDMSWQDIDFTQASIKIHGKGNKERKVYTTPDALDTLQKVNEYYKPSGQIFKMTQREARRRIWSALRPYSQAKQLSPHAIRHTFATTMAAAGVNCATLQQMLGHKTMETTQHYIDAGQLATQKATREHCILS